MGKSKTIILVGVIVVALAIGYYFLNNNGGENTELSHKMKAASKDYFEKNVSVNDTTSIYKITLERLENSGEEYDLSGLENCDKEKTYANVTVNFKNGEAKDIEVKLSC